MLRYVDEYVRRFSIEYALKAEVAFKRVDDSAEKASTGISRLSDTLGILGPRLGSAGERLITFSQANAELARQAQRARGEPVSSVGAEMDAELEQIREQMGAGAAVVQDWGRGLELKALRGLTGGNPALMKVAGGATYLGGQLLKGLGTGSEILTLANKLGFLRRMTDHATRGKNLLALATKVDILAEQDKIGVAGREAEALSGVTREAGLLGRTMQGIPALGAWATGGIGLKALLGTEAGVALGGGLGIGAALSSATLVTAAAAVAGVIIGKDILTGVEAGDELKKARATSQLTAQAEGVERQMKEEAKPTLGDRFWGAFALGGGTSKDFAETRWLAEHPPSREQLKAMAQQRGVRAGIVRQQQQEAAARQMPSGNLRATLDIDIATDLLLTASQIDDYSNLG